MDNIENLLKGLNLGPIAPAGDRDQRMRRYADAIADAHRVVEESLGAAVDSIIRGQVMILLAVRLLADVDAASPRSPEASVAKDTDLDDAVSLEIMPPKQMTATCPYLDTPAFKPGVLVGEKVIGAGWSAECKAIEAPCDELHRATSLAMIGPILAPSYSACLNFKMRRLAETAEQEPGEEGGEVGR